MSWYPAENSIPAPQSAHFRSVDLKFSAVLICMLSPCLFNFYAEYIMWNAGLDEAQVGIKIAGRNINNLRYADDITLMAEIPEEPKSLLTKLKKEYVMVVYCHFAYVTYMQSPSWEMLDWMKHKLESNCWEKYQ